jgi:RHS repeat-associated protein
VWDARNQLASIGAVSFDYDGFGRRIKNAAGVQLLYDGPNPVQELFGGTPSANLLTGHVDEFFVRSTSSGSRSFLVDGLGSTLALTDALGGLQSQYMYEPFGGTSETGTSTSNSFQFTGRENDGTGLYYYRSRYYSPLFGRFVSQDPIGFKGGDVNLYAYTGNDPVNYADPSGTDRQKLACSADVALNFGLGFFPGWNAVSFAGDLVGAEFRPFQNLVSGKPLVAFEPSIPEFAAGLSDAYRAAIAEPAFQAAGGAERLQRYQDLASRRGFGRKPSTQANILRRLDRLQRLQRAVSTAGHVANLLNAGKAAYDLYRCWQ